MQSDENRVVIHDLEAIAHKVLDVETPLKCASSSQVIAVATAERGVCVFTVDGDLVHIIPDSHFANCVSFHPHNSDILAIGTVDGCVRIWDVRQQASMSTFKEQGSYIGML